MFYDMPLKTKFTTKKNLRHNIANLAKTDGDQPHVRPLGFVMDYDVKLAFSTSTQKDMCKQLAATPNVEICCVDAEYNTLRICGKAVFCTTKESQQKALEVMPALANSYAVGDGKFVLLCQ